MRAILIFLLTLVALRVDAYEIPIGYYMKHKNTREVKAYINGVGSGYSWANASLQVKYKDDKSKWLYCQPDNLALTEAIYFQLLDDEIEKEQIPFSKGSIGFLGSPISSLLLNSLTRAFPCK